MPWVKLDDDFFDHIKVVRAGRDARDLWLVATCYANKNLTDGFIPADILDYLAAKAGVVADPAILAHRLVDVHLWEEAEGGWRIHDYHDYNPTAAKVRSERDDARDRMQKLRSNGHFNKEELFPAGPESSPEVRENIPPISASPGPLPGPGPGPGPQPKPERERAGEPNGRSENVDNPVDNPRETDEEWFRAFRNRWKERPADAAAKGAWLVAIHWLRSHDVRIADVPEIHHRANVPRNHIVTPAWIRERVEHEGRFAAADAAYTKELEAMDEAAADVAG